MPQQMIVNLLTNIRSYGEIHTSPYSKDRYISHKEERHHT